MSDSNAIYIFSGIEHDEFEQKLKDPEIIDTIFFSNPQTTYYLVKDLKRLKNLERLVFDLSSCITIEELVQYMKKIDIHTQITKVEFLHVQFDDFDDNRFVNILSCLPNLEYLYIDTCSMNNEDFIQGISKVPKLYYLTIKNDFYIDRDESNMKIVLNSLKNLTLLRHLALEEFLDRPEYLNIFSDIVGYLINLRHLIVLKSLEYEYKHRDLVKEYTDEEVEIIKGFQYKLPTLKKIEW